MDAAKTSPTSKQRPESAAVEPAYPGEAERSSQELAQEAHGAEAALLARKEAASQLNATLPKHGQDCAEPKLEEQD